jgi:hypothetical protein
MARGSQIWLAMFGNAEFVKTVLKQRVHVALTDVASDEIKKLASS